MFDLSLSKLVLIGAVALVVVGPERLPKVARLAGTLLGRAQRYLNEVKSEVRRDMALDELQQLRDTVHAAAQDIESGFALTTSSSGETYTQAQRVKARQFHQRKRRLRALGKRKI